MYIFYVIGYFVVLLFYSIIKKKWAISTYIIAIYLFTLVVALFIEAIFPFYEDSKRGALFFASGISLFILPFLREGPVIVELKSRVSIKKLLTVCQLVCVFLIISEILILPIVIDSFSISFSDLREGERAIQGNFVSLFFLKFVDLLSPLSYAFLTIFFYLFTFVSCRKSLLVMVFIVSLSAPYYGIISGGRTQMIYWLMALVFNFLLFYKYMSHERRRKLLRLGLFVVGFIIIYVGIATIDRFENSDMGTENSLLVYMGQPYLNFNNFIENFPTNGPITLRRIFPLSYSFIYGTESLDVYRDMITARSGMDIGVFYTLLGDLFVDVGIYGMYIYAAIYFIIATIVLKKKTMDLSTLLIVSILFLIPLQGVFYYSFWKRQVTFCALLILFFSRYIKISRV